MRRREFIAGLGSAAAIPRGALAQQPALPLIGYLNETNEIGSGASTPWNIAFHRGLREQGFVEGRSFELLYRYADFHPDRLPSLASDLARRGVSAIFANPIDAALAAQAATATIPIVFAVGNDPVEVGLVDSLNRPSKNITGATFLTIDLTGKRLELLHELIPFATSIGFLVNPTNSATQGQVDAAETAAHMLQLRLVVEKVSEPGEFEKGLRNLVDRRVEAILAGADALFTVNRQRFIAATTLSGLPVMYHLRELVEAGGLVSYGPSLSDAFYIAGGYVGRILKGERPSNLPVQQVALLQTALNLKTAKALGIDVPTSILLRADEVIE